MTFSTRVLGQHIIKMLDAQRLLVAFASVVFHDMSVPQCIVCQYEATWSHSWQQHLIEVGIVTFVSIDESHVYVLQVHFWYQVQGIADMHLYAAAQWRTFNPGAREVFLLIVYLEGMEHGPFFQSLGDAQCRISTERTQFYCQLGTYHPCEHLQQTPLHMTTCHLSV